MPTGRELYLQNLLAQAACLLFSLGETVAKSSIPLDEKWPILNELDEWFSETKVSISVEISKGNGEDLP